MSLFWSKLGADQPLAVLSFANFVTYFICYIMFSPSLCRFWTRLLRWPRRMVRPPLPICGHSIPLPLLLHVMSVTFSSLPPSAGIRAGCWGDRSGRYHPHCQFVAVLSPPSATTYFICYIIFSPPSAGIRAGCWGDSAGRNDPRCQSVAVLPEEGEGQDLHHGDGRGGKWPGSEHVVCLWH